MPIVIGRGDIASALRSLLDLRGRLPFQLDETVVPVYVTGDARVPGSAPSRVGKCVAATVGANGGVGQTPMVGFGPPDSNTYLVIKRIYVELPAGGAGRISVARMSRANALTAYALQLTSFSGQDLEGPVSETALSFGGAAVGNVNTAVGASGVISFYAQAQSPVSWYDFGRGVVCRPSEIFTVQGAVVNLSMFVTIIAESYPFSVP